LASKTMPAEKQNGGSQQRRPRLHCIKFLSEINMLWAIKLQRLSRHLHCWACQWQN